MSVEPPSSDRPTGPPSGPLSGPTRPHPTPPPGGGTPSSPPASGSGGGPSGPMGGGPGGPGGPDGPDGPARGSGGGPERPWWKSVPRIALIATAVVAAVVLIVVLTRPDDGGSEAGGEVFLQAASKTGPDPFTESTAEKSSTEPVTPSPVDTPDSGNVTRGVEGSAPGLYGGTRNVASCDVEKQISALQDAPAKNQAFASVLELQPGDVPAYLRSLTPVQLRMDTRVTNHGYRDGKATSYQAVLQTGTAVLVDDRGVPRVRCACGNPLLPPVALKSTPKRTGDSWASYDPANVVVVTPAPQVVDVFVMYDPESDEWFGREKGDTGDKDKKTDPPPDRPSPSVSSTSPSDSTSPCVKEGEKPRDGAKPCPSKPSKPSKPSDSSTSPPTSAPSEKSEPPSPEPPASDSSAPAPDGGSSGVTTQTASGDSVPESAATSPGL
ncbi:DUF6777 domain-containing protein [Streptomyces fructofermentans]|uniref:DUF6777 domain-containing protein n=1 Tax=Streptomyces fructofermentans TaxID=152141 RepID=UPI0037ACBB91